MKWIILALACIGLAFVPWLSVFKQARPYAFRVAVGAFLAAVIIILTFNLGPLKLL